MAIDQYSFLKKLDPTEKTYKLLDYSDFDNFQNIFFLVIDLFSEIYYVIDYLPKSMKSNSIYTKYFNFSQRTKPNNDITEYTFDFQYYQNIYLKILMMLLGYCDEIYFETDLLQRKSQEGKYFGLDIETNFYKLEDNNHTVFFDLIKLALNDQGALYIFFVDLHTIICVNDMRFFCFFFEGSDLNFFQKIITTEGLYLLK